MRLNYSSPRWLRAACLLGTATGSSVAAAEQERIEEDNAWPLTVESSFADPVRSPTKSALGPLVFSQPTNAKGVSREGFRPFFLREENAPEKTTEVLSLYPLLRYTENPDGRQWSVFNLIRFSRPTVQEGKQSVAPLPRSTEVWPFYLARHNPATGDDYAALFPIRGEITNRFGRDRWQWTLFPLYSRTEKEGRVIVQTPWPIFRRISGNGHQGLELWPLYGQRSRAGDYEQRFYLWPLGYRDARHLSEPVPDRREGFLPFYAKSSGPGYETHTYLWPFFGYAERTSPVKYSQKDYLWPLFVQGRGDKRYVNRWAPFYSHSRGKSSEKRWFLWPLYRHEVTSFADMQETDRKILFFLYHSTEQYRTNAPEGRVASRNHVWPLISTWSDGNGKEQVQVFSPLEPIFPNNEAVRKSYSPLFALYRYNQTAPDTYRHSLLWEFITWQRRDEVREWHVGPLVESRSGESGRFSLLRGLIGLEREPGRGWRPFAFQFSRRKAAPSQSP